MNQTPHTKWHYSVYHFTQKLITIAKKKCIPHNPTIQLWHVNLQRFHTEPTTFNLISFKFYWANSHKTIKRNSWQNYVSQLNTSTKLKTVWNKIKKIALKKSPKTPTHNNNVQKQLSLICWPKCSQKILQVKSTKSSWKSKRVQKSKNQISLQKIPKTTTSHLP